MYTYQDEHSRLFLQSSKAKFYFKLYFLYFHHFAPLVVLLYAFGVEMANLHRFSYVRGSKTVECAIYALELE